MKSELLKLLATNARYTNEQLAVMLGKTEAEVAAEIETYEKRGIIGGYKAVIDWDRLEDPYVSAIIELNVVPKADLGFEEVAQRIASYKEVESVYLISGVYDLNVVVKGKSLQDVANFVAKELSAMESVTSTATHFVMRRYKELDVELLGSGKDERGSYLL
jgi:DNA-binding Lrp family transcriptional regulator